MRKSCFTGFFLTILPLVLYFSVPDRQYVGFRQRKFLSAPAFHYGAGHPHISTSNVLRCLPRNLTIGFFRVLGRSLVCCLSATTCTRRYQSSEPSVIFPRRRLLPRMPQVPRLLHIYSPPAACHRLHHHWVSLLTSLHLFPLFVLLPGRFCPPLCLP